MSNLDFQYKLLFLGDTSVGKTSLIIRYVEDKFEIDNGLPTLGVDVKYKYVSLENKKIRLDIWDTAGQERFKNITKNYFRGANGIFFVCDITNKGTFDKLKQWLGDAKTNVEPETEMIIVGNKIDLGRERVVDINTLKDFGNKNKIEVFETSAKTGEGVEEIFSVLTKKLFQNKNIGIVLPSDDELSMRRGSYILNKEQVKNRPKNKTDGGEGEGGCNC